MSYRPKPVVSVKDARKILGKMAKEITDEEIIELVDNLDAIAIDALRQVREKRMQEDAMAFAELLYDISQDKKSSSPDNRYKKE